MAKMLLGRTRRKERLGNVKFLSDHLIRLIWNIVQPERALNWSLDHAGHSNNYVHKLCMVCWLLSSTSLFASLGDPSVSAMSDTAAPVLRSGIKVWTALKAHGQAREAAVRLLRGCDLASISLEPFSLYNGRFNCGRRSVSDCAPRYVDRTSRFCSLFVGGAKK